MADSLTDTLLWLVDIPSVIGEEAAICTELDRRIEAAGIETVRYGNGLVAGARTGKPLLLLVGHIDTVPDQGQGPARIEGDRLHGLGSTDMKSGVAVMLHLLESDDVRGGPYDVVGVFYDQEEGPVANNQLAPILDDQPWLCDAEFAIVLEPTDMRIELGCNGAMNVVCRFFGKSAHGARPWLGVNAITRAVPLLGVFADHEPIPFEQAGHVFYETMTVSMASGGISRNVVPGQFEFNVNYRFPPTMTISEAESRFREFAQLADELEFVDRAPAAPIPEDNPHLDRLAKLSGAELAPKQAWTDVARLEQYGIPAVNYGPGEVALAHQAEESVPLANLGIVFEHLKAFFAG